METPEPVAEESKAVIPQQSRLFNKVGLPLAKALGWILMTILGPTKVSGSYRVPKEGGVLILSTHQADVDPIAVQLATSRTVYFMAKSELFSMPVLGKVIRWFAAFPVRRGEPDRQSIKTAVALLKRGEAVCVYPEGELSQTGDILPLKPGVVLIMRMAGVPVICLGLNGTRRIMPYGSLIPRPAFRTVKVNWGEPRTFDKKDDVEKVLGWVKGQFHELTGIEE